MKKLRVSFGLLLFAFILGIAGGKQVFAEEWDKAALTGGASMEQAVNLPELTIVSGNVTSGQEDRYYSFQVKDTVWYNINFYSAKNLTFYLYNAKGKMLFRRTGGFEERQFEPWPWNYSGDFFGKLVHGKYYIRVSGASGAVSGGKYQDAFGDYEIFAFKSILDMEFTIAKDHAVYTGKEIPLPKITVKNAAGEVVSPEEYEVKLYNGYNEAPVDMIKEVGLYQIVICPKGNFAYKEHWDDGDPDNIMYFSVKPTKVKSFRLSSKKKGCIQVSAKKAKSATGCTVMISTDPKFEKKIKTYKMKTGKITITNLKSKKRYYVKLQNYNKVEYPVSWMDENDYHFMVADWSRVKSIVCK